MAAQKLHELIENIKGVFKGRDIKKQDLRDQEESIINSIEKIKSGIDGLSYKALIEEDKTALKEYESLKINLEEKEKEMELIKEKLQALNKFEVDKETNDKAIEIYNATQKEIDSKSKKIGKLTTDYYKAKVELAKAVKDIIELHKEIHLLPKDMGEVIDLINPEDIGKTEEEIKEYKENMRDIRHLLDIFKDNRFKYIDKNVPIEEVQQQILNGVIRINPYTVKKAN